MTVRQRLVWMIQEIRYRIAKRKVEKCIRTAEACLAVMNEAVNRQMEMNRQMEIRGAEE